MADPGPPDWADDDRTAIARAMIAERVERGQDAPGEVALSQAITDITITDTMEGSSTVEVKLWDEGWELVDSGFFDAQRDGRFEKIDLNYPKESRYWWRMTQVQIQGRRGGAELTLVWMERAAAWMMAHKGPQKARRSKMTRAEFIASLVNRIDKEGKGLKFVSEELHEKQPIEDT